MKGLYWLNRMVSDEGNFQLIVFNSRYFDGEVHAALLRDEAAVERFVEQYNTDWGLAAMGHYLNENDWFPAVRGRNLSHALEQLEDKVARIPLNFKPVWAAAVRVGCNFYSDYNSGFVDDIPPLPKSLGNISGSWLGKFLGW